MLNPAILIGLVIIFVCGGFVLLNAEKTDETRPEDDDAIVTPEITVTPEIINFSEYQSIQRQKRGACISILVAAILAVAARFLLA